MNNNSYHHISVLLEEAVDALNVIKGGKYIDATAGGGGHSGEIVKRGGIVLAIDRDKEAIEHLKKKFGDALIVCEGNFKDIKKITNDCSFSSVNGIIFDLGLSSNQLQSEGRGFSFRNEEKLDMRMDKNQSLTAYDVVNSYSKEELVRIFMKYGEEHNAQQIAELIVKSRKEKKIETTTELSRLVMKVRKREEKIHPATRIFQAIRIEVNDELNALRFGLEDAITLLSPGGRVVVISFHSLEDRIVKKLFDEWRSQGMGEIVSLKPITANEDELLRNRRSRSAKMRVFKKN